MNRVVVSALMICFVWLAARSLSESGAAAAAETPFEAGFAEADITPELGEKPVYLAGFGHNRKATAVHDPLKARAVVFKHGGRKVAVVSLDLVGFFHANVQRVRDRLPGFTYVLVTSTHNHEGPDTLGLWGRNAFTRGDDAAYVKLVEERAAKAVHDADAAARPVTAVLGTVRAAELLYDGREPYLKHDDLVALLLRDAKTEKPAGAVVQWNCHPETLDDRNTEVSADFVGYTVRHLQDRFRCPAVYLTGTVGGLLTSLKVELKDDRGKELKDGTFEKTERYGRLVGESAERALSAAKTVRLAPIEVRSRPLYLPLDNKVYLLARQLGVLDRQGFLWAGDSAKAEPADPKEAQKPLCVRTEIAWVRLGELDVAAVPGEIYPELVLGKVQEPADPGADFPGAAAEPGVYAQLKGPHRMLIGLANDEIGYIIPKRQWDEKAPFCYGRKKAQYGEINSLGPETAPLLCQAFADMVKGKK